MIRWIREFHCQEQHPGVECHGQCGRGCTEEGGSAQGSGSERAKGQSAGEPENHELRF